jgi:hypothetical protein
LNSTMQLVGRCTAQMKTAPKGLAPSAKHVSVLCLLAVAFYGIYTFLRIYKPQWLPALQRERGHYLLNRTTVAPYKRKDNSWSTEQII